jgi:hypothetical protein
MDKVFTGLNISNPPVSVTQKNTVSNKDIFLYLKVDRKMVKVNVDEILWIESLRDYIKVVLKGQITDIETEDQFAGRAAARGRFHPGTPLIYRLCRQGGKLPFPQN